MVASSAMVKPPAEPPHRRLAPPWGAANEYELGGSCSEFGFEPAQQLGMNAGVDLFAQDLLCALDGQCGNLVAQRLTRLQRLLGRFGLGRSDDLGAFFACARLGLFD